MVSKRDLGVSYILGTGLGLIVSLVGYLALVDPAADVFSLGTVTALGFAGSLPPLGFWLRTSDLPDSAVWAVAKWCAIGIAVPAVLAGGLIYLGYHPRIVVAFPHLLVNLVAAGGMVGALLSLIVQLRRQHERAEALNRRNSILNHIMRHDIRNDVGVIQGHTELIADRLDEEVRPMLRPIENKSKDILETSEVARQIQSIDEDPDRKPVDVAETVSAYADDARETYPESTITTDLPEHAWADAGELLRAALANLVENAIEHADRPAEVTVTVETVDDSVVLIVADNGPGIPDAVRRSVLGGGDDPKEGPAGLGLWLVKWLVEGYGGELEIEDRAPRGTAVRLILPASTRQRVAA